MNAVGILNLSSFTRIVTLASNIERPLLVFEVGFKKNISGEKTNFRKGMPSLGHPYINSMHRSITTRGAKRN